MNSNIKRKIRQRKIQYRKAKISNNSHVWQKFRKLKNEVVPLIRQEKQSIYERLSLKLKSNSLSSREWWKTLKTYISPTTKCSIPPLYDIETDNLAVDDVDKATVLKGGYLDFSHLTELKYIYITEIYMKKTIQIINN